jgi:hypothetical protein
MRSYSHCSTQESTQSLELRGMGLICAAFLVLVCSADTIIEVPRRPDPITGNAPETSTFVPFLINNSGVTEMRYQQVYAASAFSNVAPQCIYITRLGPRLSFSDPPRVAWTIRNMQINLSTTQRSVDDLSLNFAENVGPDDTEVFGPGQHDFSGDGALQPLLITLEKPFRYNPTSGNLLLDVRIFDASGPIDTRWPALDAQDTNNDSVSAVSATNVMAEVAGSAGTVGFYTLIQFSGVPSLQSEFLPVYLGSLSNIIIIRWPSQPNVFTLQRISQLENNSSWQNATNKIEGSPDAGDRWIELPATFAGPAGFFRLVWESGQAAAQSAAPIMGNTK